jgi:secondary thiamine-phosphate synthase enzyme
MKRISLKTASRSEMLNITSDVQQYVRQSGVKNGLCTVFAPHTTAAVTVNENADPHVKNDILHHLDKMVPVDPYFSHAEGNSDSHIKSSLMGVSKTFIIEKGKLVLGTWQGIFFCEFDGPRKREIIVSVHSTNE